MLQVAVRWQLKTFDGNIACHAGTTIGLISQSIESLTFQLMNSLCISSLCFMAALLEQGGGD